MGIAVFIFLFFDFIIIILIISIMKLFAFRILGVAMLIVCTSAAPLSEERRGENVFKCDTDGYMSSGRHKLKCGRGLESGPYEMQRGWRPVVSGDITYLRGQENMMQNGPGGEEKRVGDDPGTGTDMMQNGGEEERATDMMQNGEEKESNMMQNGGEKRETSMMQNGGEKRETSMMQNGGEEKRQGCEEPGAPGCNVATGTRQGSENLMQNGGEEKRVCVTPGGPGCNDNLMQHGPGGEEERRGNMFMNPNWMNDYFNFGNGG